MSETITATKPKACKYCKHWEELQPNRWGYCHGAGGNHDPDDAPDGFMAMDEYKDPADLVSGPDFYCCHFKEKS